MKKIIIIAIVIIPVLLVLFFHYQMTATAKKTPPEDVPYLIILGAKVNGTQMSLALLNRANKALEYLKENPQTKAVVTGGQGPGEEITEAEALYQYLSENGIEAERILLEDQSTSTYENLKFTKDLYQIDEAVIVSNDFHLYRSIELAEKVGIRGFPLAAETPKVVTVQLYIREYAALLKMLITGK